MTSALRLGLYGLLVGSLLTACRKKQPELVPAIDAFQGHACRLLSQTNTDGSLMEFRYDAAGRLTRIDRWGARYHFLTFDYNPDGTLKARENQFYTDSIAQTREEFRYLNGRLTEAQRFSRRSVGGPLQPDTRRAFNLDSAGRIIQIRYFFRVNGGERESGFTLYGYDARNRISELNFRPPAEGGRVAAEWQYRHDSGLNPRYRSAAFPDDPTTYSLNNPVSFEVKDFIGNLDLCGNRPVRYRYNAQGYPIRWLPNCADREVEAEYACP